MALTDDVLGLPTPVSLDPGQWRKLESVWAPVIGTATAASTWSGVRHSASTTRVSTAGSSLTVEELVGAMSSPLAGADGVYVWRTPEKTLTIPTADSVQDRIDIVYVRIWDTSVDTDGLDGVDAVYLAGTPGGSAPNPPTGTISLRIATITVPAGGSGTAEFDAPLLPMAVLPVRTASDLPTSDVPVGALADIADTAVIKRWSGTAWQEIARAPQRITTGATAEPNWSVAGLNATITAGPFISGTVSVNRTGADLTPDAVGNIAADEPLAILPESLWPADDEYTSCGNGSGQGEAAINPLGEVRLRSWTVGNTIDSADAPLRVNLDYNGVAT